MTKRTKSVEHQAKKHKSSGPSSRITRSQASITTGLSDLALDSRTSTPLGMSESGASGLPAMEIEPVIAEEFIEAMDVTELMNDFELTNYPEEAFWGPMEVGIAISGDTAIDMNERLALYDKKVNANSTQSLCLAFSRCAFEVPESARATFDMALLLVMLNGWHGDFEQDGVHYSSDADVQYVHRIDPMAGNSRERVKQALSSLSNEGLKMSSTNLIFATKVNFFLTNHHTGQGLITGYAKKVLQIVLGKDAAKDPSIVSAMHKLGHLVSTRMTYHKWKPDWTSRLSEIQRAYAISRFPAMTEDVRLRMESFPSGTAKLAFVAEALRKASMSIASIVMEDFGYGHTLPELISSVKKDPLSYHTSARFLVGESNRITVSVPEQLIASASVFVDVFQRGTTLARSMQVMTKADADVIVPGLRTRMIVVMRAMASFQTTPIEVANVIIGLSGGELSSGLREFADKGAYFDVQKFLDRAREMKSQNKEGYLEASQKLTRAFSKRRAEDNPEEEPESQRLRLDTE